MLISDNFEKLIYKNPGTKHCMEKTSDSRFLRAFLCPRTLSTSFECCIPLIIFGPMSHLVSFRWNHNICMLARQKWSDCSSCNWSCIHGIRIKLVVFLIPVKTIDSQDQFWRKIILSRQKERFTQRSVEYLATFYGVNMCLSSRKGCQHSVYIYKYKRSRPNFGLLSKPTI
jgi:hypothetical protein